jgi:hypothetical protein
VLLLVRGTDELARLAHAFIELAGPRLMTAAGIAGVRPGKRCKTTIRIPGDYAR